MNNFQAKVYFLILVLTMVLVYNIGKPFSFVVAFLIIAVIFRYAGTFFGSSWKAIKAETAAKMVGLAGVRGKKVYDLGSGDGRIVALAAKNGANATGIEIDPTKWLLSKLRLRGTEGSAVVLGSFFKQNLRDADVIFAYLPQPTLDELQAKLKRLRKGTKVVTHVSKCKGLKLIKELKKDKIYVYKL